MPGVYPILAVTDVDTPTLVGTLPAGARGWQYLVTGTFPKQVLARTTPTIATPKALRFLVAPWQQAGLTFWCVANLQVFADDEVVPPTPSSLAGHEHLEEALKAPQTSHSRLAGSSSANRQSVPAP